MDKTTLLKEISSAFPMRPLPNVVAGNVTSYEDEYSYIEKYFKGKEWNSFNFKDLYDNYQGPQDACLAFMSPVAFRYYLPSFMSIALNEYEEADLLVDTTLYSLIPNKENNNESEIFNKFTQEQIQVIIEFITYLKQTHAGDFSESEINPALNYWKNKLTSKST